MINISYLGYDTQNIINTMEKLKTFPNKLSDTIGYIRSFQSSLIQLSQYSSAIVTLLSAGGLIPEPKTETSRKIKDTIKNTSRKLNDEIDDDISYIVNTLNFLQNENLVLFTILDKCSGYVYDKIKESKFLDKTNEIENRILASMKHYSSELISTITNISNCINLTMNRVNHIIKSIDTFVDATIDSILDDITHSVQSDSAEDAEDAFLIRSMTKQVLDTATKPLKDILNDKIYSSIYSSLDIFKPISILTGRNLKWNFYTLQ